MCVLAACGVRVPVTLVFNFSKKKKKRTTLRTVFFIIFFTSVSTLNVRVPGPNKKKKKKKRGNIASSIDRIGL